MKAGRNRRMMVLRSQVSGLVSRLLQQLGRGFKSTPEAQPRLALVERITLAPRQSLALVEAEGRRLLIATSAEGGPVFYALDGARRTELRRQVKIS